MSRETLIWAARAFALTTLVLLVATLIAQPLAGRAQSEGAVPAPDTQAASYGSPLVIPAADFSSDGTDPDGFSFSFSGGYISGSSSLPCIKAPAYLPAGATVVSVWASVYDNAAPGAIQLYLRRVNVSSGDSQVMASLGTSTDSADIQQIKDLEIGFATVLYPDYAYYLTTCLTDVQHRLYSVRIYYTGP